MNYLNGQTEEQNINFETVKKGQRHNDRESKNKNLIKPKTKRKMSFILNLATLKEN
jgi:hypothetical protein